MGEDFVKNCSPSLREQGVTQEEMKLNSIYAKPLLNFEESPGIKKQDQE